MEVSWQEVCWGCPWETYLCTRWDVGEEGVGRGGVRWVAVGLTTPQLGIMGGLELEQPIRDLSHWAHMARPSCYHFNRSLDMGPSKKGVTLGEGSQWLR